MAKQFTKERRKALRAKRILSIQYRLVKGRDKSADKKWYLSTTHDMSVLGISFLSEVPFNVDDILELQIIMSGVVEIFKGCGRVVRIERKKTGALYLIAVQVTEHKNNTKKERPSKKKPSS